MNTEILILLIFGIGIISIILAIIYRYDNFMPFLAVSLASFCIGTGILVINHETKDAIDNLQTISIEINDGNETKNKVAE